MARDGEAEVKFKKIVQVGVNTIIDDEANSVITSKVLCNTQALIDINRCMHCEYNDGLVNQYLMGCLREHDQELPESLNQDPDYKDVEGN